MRSRLFVLLSILVVVAGMAFAATSRTGRVDVGATLPSTCTVGDLFFQTSSTISLYECTATNTFTQLLSSGSFATVTLNNLTTTSINAALLPNAAAGFDFGSSSLPWAKLWFAGTSGTPASNNFNITGAATGARTITFPDNSGTVGELNLAQTWTSAQTSSGGFVDTSTTIKAKRVTETGGTGLVSGDFALSAAWGSTGAISSITGTDGAWTGTITPGGTGIAGSPTLTLTFHDGTWTNAPICISKVSGGTGSITDLQDAPTATTDVITYDGLPVSGSTYIFTSVCIGR